MSLMGRRFGGGYSPPFTDRDKLKLGVIVTVSLTILGLIIWVVMS